MLLLLASMDQVGIKRTPYDRFCQISIAIAIAMLVTVYYVMPSAPGLWRGALAFAVLALVSELRPVSLRDNLAEVTISAPIHWATMVVFGPFLAMTIAGVAVPTANITGLLCARWLDCIDARGNKCRYRGLVAILAGMWKGRASYGIKRALQIIIANSALDVINVGLAALAYRAVGGYILAAEPFKTSSTLTIVVHLVFPFIVGIATYFVVDEARYAITCLVCENQPQNTKDWYSFVLRLKMLLMETVPLTMGQYILLPPVTILMVYLYLDPHVGALSGLVVIGPFLSLRLAVQKSVEQERVYLDTIATLGTYMQHYHPYTRGHLKRVADMSERLARELRLQAESILLMPYAGLLHDIGKIGVSEEILDKVGQLTDEEWAKIKEHPVTGAEIVQHLEFLDKTVDWIKYHHKWENGSGYPANGVGAGEMPIEASIIAVADAFDAMTDDREISLEWSCDACGYKPDDEDERPIKCPKCGAEKRRTYRQPLSVEEAINELRRGAGSQFAPNVVKAFLKMADNEGIRLGSGK